MSKIVSSECFLVQSPLASQSGVIIGRNACRANADADEQAVEVIYLPAQPEAEATQKVYTIYIFFFWQSQPTFGTECTVPSILILLCGDLIFFYVRELSRERW